MRWGSEEPLWKFGGASREASEIRHRVARTRVGSGDALSQCPASEPSTLIENHRPLAERRLRTGCCRPPSNSTVPLKMCAQKAESLWLLAAWSQLEASTGAGTRWLAIGRSPTVRNLTPHKQSLLGRKAAHGGTHRA